ncbi:hypothetical protein BDQ12DRAFT_725172 [Crucibulum laeve]|uniref:F-box domain-containing protein n=1 Tax=Crucibulum laeve TaxID=68775 RepID=A0A5C3LUF3_9AGAR|nr:hypothetical protein BDQ12DRAFT_725172 [Crucibulum laeve]
MEKNTKDSRSPSFVSPFDEVPVEILENILSFYPDGVIKGRRGTVHLGVISSVCKKWQAVATNIPEFWACFEVTISPAFSYPSPPILNMWLERSGFAPLSFSLTMKNFNYQISSLLGNLPELLCDLLLREVHRWRNVAFTFPEVDPDNSLFPPNLEAPFLKSLEVYCHSSWSTIPARDILWLSSLASNAPSLQRFTAHGAEQFRDLPVPWERLTHLYLQQSISEQDARDILERSPCLFSCNLIDTGVRLGGQSSLFSSPEMITCNSEELGVCTRGDLGRFFSVLDAPNIKSLEVVFVNCSATWDISMLPKFLSGSRASEITNLSIRNCLLSNEQLLTCLRSVSLSLTDLNILSDNLSAREYIKVENVDETVLRALTHNSDSSSVLCPRLRNITFERCLSESDDGILSDMVESRWKKKTIQELRSVTVVFRYHTHPVDAVRLRKMITEGLGGEVRFGPPQIFRHL